MRGFAIAKIYVVIKNKNKRHMKKIILFIYLILFALIVQAQKPRIKFEKLSVENGMSQSSVLSIMQDSQGFMWFATLDGLNKYDGYDFKVYWNSQTKEHTISDNMVNVLFETKDKTNPTFWIGTAANGLCKYNKLKDNFESFKHSQYKENSISNNNINDIVGNNEILWIATDKGLNKFNQNINNFTYFSPSKDKNSISSDTILCLEFDLSGNLWIGTKTGLNFLNTTTNKIKSFKHLSLISNTEINDIYTENDIVWLGTSIGLFSYSISKDKLTEHKINIYSKKGTSVKADITSVIKDKNNILCLGTRTGGLIRFNLKTYNYFTYKHEAINKHSLSTNSILSIYRDKSDILWVGTSLGGVNKWNRAAEDLDVFRHNPYDENSLSASQVRSFFVDKDQNIWVGTVEGGLNKWDKQNDKFFHYKKNPKKTNSLSHNHIRSILEDSKNRFWVATDGGGLNLFNKKNGTFKHYIADNSANSISHNRVWKILEDNKQRLWVGTFGGGLNLFNPKKESFKHFQYSEQNKNSISSDLVTSILQDSKGTLWIGTFSGLNKLNPETESFTRYTNDKNNSNSISNDRIYSIFEDTEENLWIGTKGGLNKFDRQNNQFTVYNRDNSELPNNVILGITEEGEYLWLSTNNGISRMHKETGKIKNFDMGDGLQSNEFLAGSFYKKKDGEILFGGIDGFNAFYPKNITDNPHKPPIVITGFQISNQYIETDTIISSKKQIVLDYYQNDISFDFVALDFIFPQKNKYKYMLEGDDKEWINAGFRRFAKYTNLQPGNYTFKVIGSNNDDVWNEEGTSFNLIIQPAFWQTLWFKILLIVFVVSATFIFFKLRIRTIKKRNEELEAEVKRRTLEIRQQNDEIKAQRDELAVQKDYISEQKQEITDSIHYAKKIQTAALPTNEYITDNIPEHFILFKPRDIVSGDFYWVGKKGNKIIITAVDCTGHGVPGAFMSMLGISFLNKIVNEKNITDSGEILNRLRTNIINALHPKGYEIESKDGMDMSLCVIDTENNTIDFSGAYNPLFLMQNGTITEIKADRMPVARYDIMEPFTVNKINIQKGDSIYMFSDGYPDQFGGPKNKKFMKGKLRKMFEDIYMKPMSEQHQILDNTIEEWKGDEPQIDDIIIIGIRL